MLMKTPTLKSSISHHFARIGDLEVRGAVRLICIGEDCHPYDRGRIMKITTTAGALADTLVLAASITEKANAALEAVHIKTVEGAARITANSLDHMLTLTVPATVQIEAEVAVSAGRLAALTAALPAKAAIEVEAEADDNITFIKSGKSRFKLAILPPNDLPSPLKLAEEIGRVDLAREELLTLLVPSFAVSTERTRYYLNGILLHDIDGGLAAVGTDSNQLCPVLIPGAVGLSQDRHLIVPSPALKIIAKLMANRNAERVTLRRSKTLFAVETNGAIFTTKLIDANYPAYERIVLDLRATASPSTAPGLRKRSPAPEPSRSW
jgi:DNA polymerase III subunit beta